jgi:hypothetical protein
MYNFLSSNKDKNDVYTLNIEDRQISMSSKMTSPITNNLLTNSIRSSDIEMPPYNMSPVFLPTSRPSRRSFHYTESNVRRQTSADMKFHRISQPALIMSDFENLKDTLQNHHIMDQLLPYEYRANWFISMVFCFIDVFRLLPLSDVNVNWYGLILNDHAKLFASKSRRLFKGLTLGFCLGIYLLYVYWLRLVPNISNLKQTIDPYFSVFILFESCAPFFIWIMYLFNVVKKENIQAMKVISLFKMALKPGDDPHRQLSLPDYQLLRGLSSKINSLKEIGQINIQARYEKNICKLKWYVALAIGWSILMCASHGYWIGSYLMHDNCTSFSSGPCYVFILLLIASIIHFTVPALIVALFIFKTKIATQDIDIFYDMNMGEIRTGDVGSLLRYQNNNLDEMSTQWQWIIILQFIIPTISMFCILISATKNPGVIFNAWFFIVYGVYDVFVSLIVFYRASRITVHSSKIRKCIHGDIACADAYFCDDSGSVAAQNIAYIFYLYDGYSGFKIIGVTITEGVFAAIFSVMIPVASWLANNMSLL